MVDTLQYRNYINAGMAKSAGNEIQIIRDMLSQDVYSFIAVIFRNITQMER